MTDYDAQDSSTRTDSSNASLHSLPPTPDPCPILPAHGTDEDDSPGYPSSIVAFNAHSLHLNSQVNSDGERPMSDKPQMSHNSQSRRRLKRKQDRGFYAQTNSTGASPSQSQVTSIVESSMVLSQSHSDEPPNTQTDVFEHTSPHPEPSGEVERDPDGIPLMESGIYTIDVNALFIYFTLTYILQGDYVPISLLQRGSLASVIGVVTATREISRTRKGGTTVNAVFFDPV